MTEQAFLEYLKKGSNDIYKYVNMGNNEYRFCTNYDYHAMLVQEGEKPLSAGTFSVFKKIRIMDTYSSTLKICSDDKDWQYIANLLNMEVYTDWDELRCKPEGKL